MADNLLSLQMEFNGAVIDSIRIQQLSRQIDRKPSRETESKIFKELEDILRKYQELPKHVVRATLVENCLAQVQKKLEELHVTMQEITDQEELILLDEMS